MGWDEVCYHDPKRIGWKIKKREIIISLIHAAALWQYDVEYCTKYNKIENNKALSGLFFVHYRQQKWNHRQNWWEKGSHIPTKKKDDEKFKHAEHYLDNKDDSFHTQTTNPLMLRYLRWRAGCLETKEPLAWWVQTWWRVVHKQLEIVPASALGTCRHSAQSPWYWCCAALSQQGSAMLPG